MTLKTSSAVTIHGQTIHFFESDFIGKIIVNEGVYEKETLEFLSTILAKINSPIVLDVGGNIGNHSLVFSLNAKQVHTFEPIPYVFDVLCKNIDVNNISNIQAHNLALSNCDENAKFYVNISGNIGGSSFDKRNDFMEEVTVIKKSGDAYINTLNLEKIDLLKIDVEGHEFNVLDGLKETIFKFKPIVCLEWADPQAIERIVSNRILEILFTDYKIFVLGTNFDKKFWNRKPLGKIRRKLTQMKAKKCAMLYEFDPSVRYENILLVPQGKIDLVKSFTC